MILIGVGFLGGLARALYGLLKAVVAGDEVDLRAFVVTLIISAVIGGMLGFVFDVDYKIAALAGYVGTDVLDNVFKGSMGGSINLSKK